MNAAKNVIIICRRFALCRRLRDCCRAGVCRTCSFTLFLPESGHAAARLLATALVFVKILQFFPVDKANAACFVAADEVYLL